MQEGIGNIQLPNGPVKVNSQSKDNPNCGCLNDSTKGLFIVNAILLLKPLGYQSSFEPLNASIRFLFDAIHPFISNDMLIRGSREQGPGTITD
jgi:hypothetical protein